MPNAGNIVAMLRKQRWMLIRQDPMTVVLHRISRARRDTGPTRFGRSDDEIDIAPQTARMMIQGARQSSGNLDVAIQGQYVSTLRYALMMFWDADIDASSQILDEFDHPDYGHFEVREVMIETKNGQIYGKTAMLQRVV